MQCPLNQITTYTYNGSGRLVCIPNGRTIISYSFPVPTHKDCEQRITCEYDLRNTENRDDPLLPEQSAEHRSIRQLREGAD